MNTGRSALLLMDFQNGVVARQPGALQALERAGAAIKHARNADVLVVYVRVAFRDGNPEVSPNNGLFTGIVGGGDFAEMAASTQIHSDIAPEAGDVVVTKRRVGAFAGSDLEVVLRSQEISTLVLAGISTSGVVLTTVRDGADRDYRIIVLSDACTDRNADVHEMLLEKVFPMQALVMRVDEWIGGSDP